MESRDTTCPGLKSTKLGGDMKYGMKNIVILALAMGLVAACAGDDKSTKNVASDPIKARQSLMKSNIGNLKAIGAYLKTGKGSAADVAARARAISDGAKQMAGLFPAGTSSKDKPGETRAKPGIWAKKGIHNQAEDMAAFKQAASMMSVYAMRLADAAGSGDKKAIGAAMGQLGKKGCAGCHKDFRGPKPKK